MDIVSSRVVVFKCKMCKHEKPHASQGICIAPVCIDCTKTLPPIPPGQRRCPTCLDLHDNLKRAYCKPCWSQYRKDRYNAEEKRDAHLRRTYGITAQEYDLMFFRQGGCCAICRKPEKIIDPYTGQPKALVVDHDHSTGETRELLCHYCNILLGSYEHDIERMKAVMNYHKKHLT